VSFRPEEVRELLIEHTADALVAMARPGDTAESLAFDGSANMPVEKRDAAARRYDSAHRLGEEMTKRRVGADDWMRFRSQEAEKGGRRRGRRQASNPLTHRGFDAVFVDSEELHFRHVDGRRIRSAKTQTSARTRERSALYLAVARRLGELDQSA
jgi:hypothetical protein